MSDGAALAEATAAVARTTLVDDAGASIAAPPPSSSSSSSSTPSSSSSSSSPSPSSSASASSSSSAAAPSSSSSTSSRRERREKKEKKSKRDGASGSGKEGRREKKEKKPKPIEHKLSDANKGDKQKNLQDKYTLLQELGSGEFSKVYKASVRGSDELFAVKLMNKADVNLARLSTEIAILQKVSHPNIIFLKEYVEMPKKVYIVTELVTGGELFSKIVELGSYTENLACAVIRKIMSAVEYLHAQGIVHRDLKPTNLLLKSSDDVTEVKIADFGLSKLVDEETMMKTACGTPIYVAPEVLDGQGYTNMVDLWSIGVIMYILLCGFPPFYDDGTNIAGLFEQIMEGDYDFPPQYWDRISDSAKDLITHLLEVSPDDRYSATQALQHPWLKAGEAKPEQELGLQQDLKAFKEANVVPLARAERSKERMKSKEKMDKVG